MTMCKLQVSFFCSFIHLFVCFLRPPDRRPLAEKLHLKPKGLGDARYVPAEQDMGTLMEAGDVDNLGVFRKLAQGYTLEGQDRTSICVTNSRVRPPPPTHTHKSSLFTYYTPFFWSLGGLSGRRRTSRADLAPPRSVPNRTHTNPPRSLPTQQRQSPAQKLPPRPHPIALPLRAPQLLLYLPPFHLHLHLHLHLCCTPLPKSKPKPHIHPQHRLPTRTERLPLHVPLQLQLRVRVRVPEDDPDACVFEIIFPAPRISAPPSPSF